LAQEGEPVWDKVVKMILNHYSVEDILSAELTEWSRGWNYSHLMQQRLPASWVLKLRELPCLPDTQGVLRKPSELLRRTPQTEIMQGIEPFLDLSLDKEEFHRKLDALGVRTRPLQPEIFFNWLRALAEAPNPPIPELENLYAHVDRLFDHASTEETEQMKKAFQIERLIFSDSSTWETASSVFLMANEEDVPGAPLIRESLRGLSLWRKVGVADRPSIELAIKWLKELEAYRKLSSEDLKRARAILPRAPVKIWNKCQHWLNLSGEWMPCKELNYSLSMQSLIAWEHLYEPIKKQTADFRSLPATIVVEPPFSEIPTLASTIEERLSIDEASLVGKKEPIPWLNAFGKLMYRITISDKAKNERIRELALSLSKIKQQQVRELNTTPYIGSQPVGTSRQTDVAWIKDQLYIMDIHPAKLAKRIPEEIAKLIEDTEIKAALSYCYKRTDGEIQEYLEENFDLLPPDKVESEPPVPDDRMEEPETDLDREEPVEISFEPTTNMVTEEMEGEDETQVRVRTSVVPKPSLIERFALAKGFHKQDGRFCKEDGSWIGRNESGEIFPWIYYSVSGEKLCFYLPIEQCLEEEPIELAHEAWTILQKYPETHSLILVDRQGKPVERSGKELTKMVSTGQITIHPATYRIRLEG
jgi:hypothetical protein